MVSPFGKQNLKKEIKRSHFDFCKTFFFNRKKKKFGKFFLFLFLCAELAEGSICFVNLAGMVF
jgi:hypothetical protein